MTAPTLWLTKRLHWFLALKKSAQPCDSTKLLCVGRVRRRINTDADIMKAVAARAPSHLFCLGIGALSQAPAQWQMALLLEMRGFLAATTNLEPRTTVFDPLFGDVDVALLRRLGCDLPLENACGKYILHEPTLVYMPHCPKELYEALLRANWNENRLRQCILVGNTLEHYASASEARMVGFPCLTRISV